MSLEWTDGNPDVEVGEKFEGVIRHCNSKLKLEDKVETFTAAEDGFYIGNGPDELSWNWDFVKWRKLNESRDHRPTLGD